MKNLETAYIEGFIKRAADYGVNEQAALSLFKQANPNIQSAGKAPAVKPSLSRPSAKKIKPATPKINSIADQNDVAGYKGYKPTKYPPITDLD
jgi:hypothetical protein